MSRASADLVPRKCCSQYTWTSMNVRTGGPYGDPVMPCLALVWISYLCGDTYWDLVLVDILSGSNSACGPRRTHNRTGFWFSGVNTRRVFQEVCWAYRHDEHCPRERSYAQYDAMISMGAYGLIWILGTEPPLDTIPYGYHVL